MLFISHYKKYFLLFYIALGCFGCFYNTEASEDLAKQYFCSFQKTTCNNFTIQPLLGGLSGARNYYIQHEQNEYALRILDPNRTPQERLREIEAYLWANEIGIGPRIFTTFSDKVLIMEYIEGRKMSQEDATDPSSYSEIINSIKSLHCSEKDLGHKETFFDHVRERIEYAQKNMIPLPQEMIQKALLAMDNIEKDVGPQRYVFCHNDISTGNVLLRKGKYYFIDWGSCSMADPYQDLGYLSLELEMNDEQQRDMLKLYLSKAPSEEEMSHLQYRRLLSFLRIFSSNFVAYEKPCYSSTLYEQRCKKLDEIVANNGLQDHLWYLDN